jgi:hypothetical protein
MARALHMIDRHVDQSERATYLAARVWRAGSARAFLGF